MTTVLAIKKNGFVTIAADSQAVVGWYKITHEHSASNQKILRYKNNYFGSAGNSAAVLAFEDWISKQKSQLKFSSQKEIFNTMTAFHKASKNDYFFLPHHEQSRELETSRVNMILVNSQGIFSIGEFRSVIEYKTFFSIGSGSQFAIGAMNAIYNDDSKSGEEIAEIAIKTAADFDMGSGLPFTSYTIKLVKKKAYND